MSSSMNQQEYRQLETIADSLKAIRQDSQKFAQIAEAQQRFDQQYKDKFRDALLGASRSFESMANSLGELKGVASSLNEMKGNIKKLDDISNSLSTIAKGVDEIKMLRGEIAEIKNILSKGR